MQRRMRRDPRPKRFERPLGVVLEMLSFRQGSVEGEELIGREERILRHIAEMQGPAVRKGLMAPAGIVGRLAADPVLRIPKLRDEYSLRGRLHPPSRPRPRCLAAVRPVAPGNHHDRPVELFRELPDGIRIRSADTIEADHLPVDWTRGRVQRIRDTGIGRIERCIARSGPRRIRCGGADEERAARTSDVGKAVETACLGTIIHAE